MGTAVAEPPKSVDKVDKSVKTVKSVEDIVASANRSDIHRSTGIHLSHVSRILAGKRAPGRERLALLAGYFGVTMDELYVCLAARREKYLRTKAGRQEAKLHKQQAQAAAHA